MSEFVGDDTFWVIDRCGDRKSIMTPLLKAHHQFIIHQVENRDLYVNGEKMSLKQVSRKISLAESYTVFKIKDNKRVKESCRCGAKKVRLTQDGSDLWLVVLKEKGKGYCLFLCHLDAVTGEEPIGIAFRGYGHR